MYLKDRACPDCLRLPGRLPVRQGTTASCALCAVWNSITGTMRDRPAPRDTLRSCLRRSIADIDPRPLNVLATELGRHMKQHNLTSADIANVTLGGDKAEFINFSG